MSSSKSERPAFLFAPGAGAPFASAWMQEFAAALRQLGEVQGFDYPYQREGRRTPDRLPALIAAHREALEALRARHAGPIFLAGKSMGSRIGCHLSVELRGAEPAGIICFGYPLIGQNGTPRDAVVRNLTQPALFVQGTRDAMCPLDQLRELLSRLEPAHELHVVDGGDHSLRVTKTLLTRAGRTQTELDREIFSAVARYVVRRTQAD